MRITPYLLPLAASVLLACDSSQPATNESPLTNHVEGHAAVAGSDSPDLGPEIAALRQATVAFHSTAAANAAGYAPFGGCFQDPNLGGMGFHFANDSLIGDSAISELRPELLVYEPLPNGQVHLAAVEYIVFEDEWHAKGHQDPPQLFGQTFHENLTLLPKPFYLLHVWLWKDNTSGIFQDWNPHVHCPST